MTMREAEKKESKELLMMGIKQRKFKEVGLMNSISQVHDQ